MAELVDTAESAARRAEQAWYAAALAAVAGLALAVRAWQKFAQWQES